MRRLGRITRAVINTSNEVKCPLLWEFWIYNFPWRISERVLDGNIVNIRNECLFFLGSWGMNRIAEQTNRPRTASRFTRFVCPALRFIPHEPRKKDTHSLNNNIFPGCQMCWYSLIAYEHVVKEKRYISLITHLFIKNIKISLHNALCRL